MSDEQLRRLMEADEPTSAICYHGVRIIDLPHDDGLKVVRIVGHLLFQDEDVEHDTVPDHRTVAFDIPLYPETMLDLSIVLTHSATCTSRPEVPPGDDWLPVSKMPKALKRFLGIETDDENGG